VQDGEHHRVVNGVAHGVAHPWRESVGHVERHDNDSQSHDFSNNNIDAYSVPYDNTNGFSDAIADGDTFALRVAFSNATFHISHTNKDTYSVSDYFTYVEANSPGDTIANANAFALCLAFGDADTAARAAAFPPWFFRDGWRL
jgi:hypothetical protein